jgi:hypothetical protein
MIKKPALRVAVALAFALVAAGALAGPAAAESVIQDCGMSETCGYWEVRDSGPPYGANCKYETGSYDLDLIKIQPPLMHGPTGNKTKVGWQFKILRSTNSGNTWGFYYKSNWQYAMADDMIPAYGGHGFSKRTWNAPENPTGWFKVRIYMRWYSAGGAFTGNVVVEINYYKRVWNGNVDYAMDYCLQDW